MTENKKPTYEQLYNAAKKLQLTNRELKIEMSRLYMINKSYEARFREMMLEIDRLENQGSR